jgi:long-chain acyl-CoA synthetase
VSQADDTLPALLLRNASERGSAVAMREKEYGIWREVTWAEYGRNVTELALGLHELGVRRGETIAILSDNRPEWAYAVLAAQSLGALPLGLFPDTENLDLLHHMIAYPEVRYILVEDQEQTDKVLALSERLPDLRWIIVDNFRELRSYHDPRLVSLESTVTQGRALHEKTPELFHRLVDAVRSDDVAMLCTTSGTTALPKFPMLTHRNLVLSLLDFDEVAPTGPGDDVLSFLPPAWIGEFAFSIVWALISRYTINFPEKQESVQRDLREIGPSVLFWPPRMWEKVCADIRTRVQDADPVKRGIHRLFMAVGERAADLALRRQPVPLWLRAVTGLGEMALYRKLRDHYGLSRLRIAITGGAPISLEVFKFFRAIGVDICQCYGQSESATFVTSQPRDDVKLETVGRPLRSKTLRITEDGEILVSGPTLFKGYFKDPAATDKVLVDGWLRTGDHGYVDDEGQLVMIDRLGDLARLRGGYRFAPQLIEGKLKWSPYIREAIVCGDGQDYVAALVEIDMETTSKFAERRQVPFTTFADLSQKSEVHQLIAGEVERANATLPAEARVRRFALLAKQLDAEDEELTQTHKIRRRAIQQKYRAIIADLYAADERRDPDALLSAEPTGGG